MRLRLAWPVEREALEALQRRASFANAEDREALLLATSNGVQLPIEQIESGWVFVAENAGCPSGFAVIVPGLEGTVELDGLFVDPHFWRRGIGRMLVEHCTTIAKQLGARSLEVVANRHALSFYESCGFQQRGNVRTEFGTGIAMSLAL